MKKIRLFLWGVMMCLFLPLHAQYNGYKDWPKEELRLGGKYLLTDEAAALADRVMAFQLSSGAWPKNIYYPQVTDQQAAEARQNPPVAHAGTIENRATLSEIHFLSKMYQATAQRRYRKAAEEGIRFLFNAQYSTGGWPLYFPAATDGEAAVPLMEEGMVNVLQLLNAIIRQEEPYSYLSESFRQQAREAFDRGIDFLLRAQVRQNGVLVGWGAYYNPETLLPTRVSMTEPPALSGACSPAVVLFLMGIQNPDARVKAAIEGAVAWFQATAIKGWKRENYINKDGKRDFRLVSDVHAADMWARYYTLEDNRPFFLTEEGEVKYSYEELTRERRTRVSWYTNEPQKVLRRYARWKEKQTQP